MLIEDVELTISHVDLGTLNEFSAMVLFGNAICHSLVQGKPHSSRGIRDRAGQVLYPGNFLTHLRVPPQALLGRFGLFDRVSVGAELKSFGGMILDGAFALDAAGQVAGNVAEWNADRQVTLQAGILFVVDGHKGEPSPAIPDAATVVPLPKVTRPPAAVEKFGQVQTGPSFTLAEGYPLRAGEPIRHRLRLGRDLAAGHAVMFATFVRLLELGERALLSEQLFPPLPVSTLIASEVLERETYYLANAREEQTVRIELAARVVACPPNLHGDDKGWVSAGIVELVADLWDEERGLRLLASRGRKLLRVPSAETTLLREVSRWVQWAQAR